MLTYASRDAGGRCLVSELSVQVANSIACTAFRKPAQDTIKVSSSLLLFFCCSLQLVCSQTSATLTHIKLDRSTTYAPNHAAPHQRSSPSPACCSSRARTSRTLLPHQLLFPLLRPSGEKKIRVTEPLQFQMIPATPTVNAIITSTKRKLIVSGTCHYFEHAFPAFKLEIVKDESQSAVLGQCRGLQVSNSRRIARCPFPIIC